MEPAKTAQRFLSAVSNFYFFYMIVLVTVIYAAVRVIILCLFFINKRITAASVGAAYPMHIQYGCPTFINPENNLA